MTRAIALTLILLFALACAAPQSQPAASDLAPYQEIIDRLNAEYGTNVRLATAEEQAELEEELGDSQSGALTPPDAFEKALRESIERMLEARESGRSPD